MEAKESESALHCRLLRERDDEMRQKGIKEVVEWIDTHSGLDSNVWEEWLAQKRKWGIKE